MQVEGETHLSDIAAKIRSRRCVLFLGAGVHAPPPEGQAQDWPAEARPPVGSGLSLRLAERSGFATRYPDEDPRNLMRVSLDFEIRNQRTGLIDAVREEVQAKKSASPLLHALARLDFPVVVTTNYDTHFEDALYEAKKRPFVSVYRSNVGDTRERTADHPDLNPPPDEPLVLKIHGDIRQSPNSIVISDEDYIQFVMRMGEKKPYHPFPDVALTYLSKGVTLFLGYSLRDYNLRLLFKTLRAGMETKPQMYSVDYKPDPLVQAVLERNTGQVSYVVEDVWKFVPALVEATLGKKAVG